MSVFRSIKLEVRLGGDLADAIFEAYQMAVKLNLTIEFVFNDKMIKVTPDCNPVKLYQTYHIS